MSQKGRLQRKNPYYSEYRQRPDKERLWDVERRASCLCWTANKPKNVRWPLCLHHGRTVTHTHQQPVGCIAGVDIPSMAQHPMFLLSLCVCVWMRVFVSIGSFLTLCISILRLKHLTACLSEAGEPLHYITKSDIRYLRMLCECEDG